MNVQAPAVPCEKCGERNRLCRCEIDRLLALPADAATVVLPPPLARPDEPACWDFVLAALDTARPDPIDEQLRADMAARDAFGLAKYGQRLKTNDGRNPLVDGFQELLDLVVYLAKDAAEVEQKYGKWSNEHIGAHAMMWHAIHFARLLCASLTRRGVR
jgi:hypothetical protein